MRALTLKRLRAIYTHLRKRYFLDAHPPFHIPPPVSEILFSWLPENTDAIALTSFDEDGDPFEMRFNPKMMQSYAIARETVLHELAHIRLGWKPSCGGYSHAWGGGRVASSMKWHKETVRLAAAGAIRL